jgi:hypothetical protein
MDYVTLLIVVCVIAGALLVPGYVYLREYTAPVNKCDVPYCYKPSNLGVWRHGVRFWGLCSKHHKTEPVYKSAEYIEE